MIKQFTLTRIDSGDWLVKASKASVFIFSEGEGVTAHNSLYNAVMHIRDKMQEEALAADEPVHPAQHFVLVDEDEAQLTDREGRS